MSSRICHPVCMCKRKDDKNSYEVLEEETEGFPTVSTEEDGRRPSVPPSGHPPAALLYSSSSLPLLVVAAADLSQPQQRPPSPELLSSLLLRSPQLRSRFRSRLTLLLPRPPVSFQTLGRALGVASAGFGDAAGLAAPAGEPPPSPPPPVRLPSPSSTPAASVGEGSTRVLPLYPQGLCRAPALRP
jgi:hypothetical protein